MPRARKQPAAAGETTDAVAADAETVAAETGVAATPTDDVATAVEAAAILELQTRAAEDAETRAAEEALQEAAAPGDLAEPAVPAAPEPAPWPAGDRFVAGAPAISEPEPGHVRMAQASAATIRATNVDAQQSAVGRMAGSTITMSQGATGLVRGTDVRLEQGAVGAIAADRVELRDGFALLVVARRVSGNVTVLLDWRALLALLGVLLVLGRLLRGRR